MLQKSGPELEEDHQSKVNHDHDHELFKITYYNNLIIHVKSQTTLVYKDVVSFKQKPRDSSFDNKVEYAQLQDPNTKQFTTDIVNHPVGKY